jgi:hypothetical protein
VSEETSSEDILFQSFFKALSAPLGQICMFQRPLDGVCCHRRRVTGGAADTQNPSRLGPMKRQMNDMTVTIFLERRT